ncbi:hypothetical protein AMIS_58600 [Actinoplanes missouriensis 431]|uniref:Uncharacterized protein n=1 Tax=Actinoplanes missouriensis (strain ATCC 14538 / DSM 43046 / CBS 188.64 / JCM 3121 / NBRC 102363 / NCIMB 12654 / NRRL B-3342 / UNCC 431) TaxID=512565 RepID=I0HDJ3_ACTM4|nr:hypothetical protein [Actinoplanes missouriensis]BAL91080.1 hypothetical protein AMIS_58600 [Actinoplanes missouriensis 431]
MTPIDAGRFAGLLHAYGQATDTPAHLDALAGGDPAALDAAVHHLWSAIIHQGTPWTATAPAALVVAALVGDSWMSGPARAGLRADLLGFLAEVAEAGMPFPELTDLEPPPGFDLDAVVAQAVAEDEDRAASDRLTSPPPPPSPRPAAAGRAARGGRSPGERARADTPAERTLARGGAGEAPWAGGSPPTIYRQRACRRAKNIVKLPRAP